jgi:hypothetical protein
VPHAQRAVGSLDILEPAAPDEQPMTTIARQHPAFTTNVFLGYICMLTIDKKKKKNMNSYKDFGITSHKSAETFSN